ncbi:MAG: acyl-CoA dehydrogenase family protein [Saprospiraceae bacterium]|nr:acyl-CoA dehydrogenase family protein [Saprospiraceae bacterium]MBK7370113.1 acyl-CoA dehydrogenase family protein [Saprospiraceae bacterium]MBK7437817.1 acyl-CoA dehydrogenase family protein [Saprospiraceae bacterium]MBK8512134.1 acyl-CoA dehydrogenase family protein [Saprospiraceae bacterium]MBK9678967.1 acyl-CoA dehydrogenase family protein [Saprospiraceae bacterium]
MQTDVQSIPLKGGEFLVKDAEYGQTFIPEQFGEESLMVAKAAQDFLENEINPVAARIEVQEEGLSKSLMIKIGELGFLGIHMPEIYGGSDLDTNTNTLVTDILGPMGSFSTTFAAHTGIGMLPILYFGTEAQRSHYLPALITGEKIASYCLTEPGSGSDALAAKTRADLSADGQHFSLNGQKMWISNAGWADLFIVFAQVHGSEWPDGKGGFSCFLVDAGLKGLTLGEEEKKMGIKGSSTRQVFFENVVIPRSALLGEVGKGHKIAFNALNIGRFKLGAFCIGGAKSLITKSVQYANERVQFGKKIGEFGAIKYKLAEQFIRTYMAESTMYRVSNMMQEKIESLIGEGKSPSEAKLIAAEEYAIECSVLKVNASEVLDYVVDEAVQIHGGIGFSEENRVASAYRDARINRIYEGTNEINRLLIFDMLIKRAMKGHINLTDAAWAVQKELTSMPSMERPSGPLGEEKNSLKEYKKLALLVAGAAVKSQMDGKLQLQEEQEILTNCSDMLIDMLNAESLLLRIEKQDQLGIKPELKDLQMSVVKIVFHDMNARMTKNALDALSSFCEGDLLKTLAMGVKRFTKYPLVNVKEYRRFIADFMLTANQYPIQII